MTRKEQEHLVIFRILDLAFSTNKLYFFVFFAQHLKLVPLSNLKMFLIKTLNTAPRKIPVCCIENVHIWFLLELTTIFVKVYLVTCFFLSYFLPSSVLSIKYLCCTNLNIRVWSRRKMSQKTSYSKT